MNTHPRAASYVNSRLLGFVTVGNIELTARYLGNWSPGCIYVYIYIHVYLHIYIYVYMNRHVMISASTTGGLDSAIPVARQKRLLPKLARLYPQGPCSLSPKP